MPDTENGPFLSLSSMLRQCTPVQAVKIAMELCEQLPGDPESFHGGVWPENITFDDNDRAVLGNPNHTPASQRPAGQVEFAAPEYFWDREESAAADVFSVALILFAGCHHGLLPFQPEKENLTNQERADALRRRMKGESIPIPSGVSKELKAILEKALSYKAEERYITAKELLFALHWTDEALRMEDASQPAEGMETSPADMPLPPEADSANLPEETTESTEEMLLEADRVLAAAAADQPAENAGHISAQEAPVSEDETKTADPILPVTEDRENGNTAVEQDKESADQKESAPLFPSASSDPPLGENQDSADERLSRTPVVQHEYKVRKDFEKAPDRKAPTVAPTKKKRSKIIPVLCAIAVLVLLGSVGIMLYGNRLPIASEPFQASPGQDVSLEASAPSPLIISPEPSPTVEPSEAPEPSPERSAVPSPSPAAETSSEPLNLTINLPDAPQNSSMNGTLGSSSTPSSSWGNQTGSGNSSSWGGNTGSWSGGASVTPSSSYTVTPANDTVYINGIGVNIRSGPGTNYYIIGSASTGYKLLRTGLSGNWSRVSFLGTTGFVSNTYLSPTDPTAAPATSYPSPAPAPSSPDVPSPPPTLSPFTITKGDLTYVQAKEAAQAAGGLAVLHTDERFSAAIDFLNGDSTDVEYVWVGLEYDQSNSSWIWSDGTSLPADDSHWGPGYPKEGDDLVLLAKQEDASWKYVSLSSSQFEPTSAPYTGKLGYITISASV